MTDVLIRDVPDDDLDRLRAAAAAEGASLQVYLKRAVHAQAVHLRRLDALHRTEQRLRGTAPVPDAARAAVLEALDLDRQSRSDELGHPAR